MAKGKVKKGKKVEEQKESAQPLSLIEQAKQENKQGVSERKRKHGAGKTSRPITREVFKLWLILPDQFKGAPERITALLGITDEVAMELLKIDTMKKFADEFGLMQGTLTEWRKEIEGSSEFLGDVKSGMRKLTKNVMGALYRKMLEEGDGTRFTAWMKVVEDWREQLGVEHSGHVSNLTEHERAEVDRLISKNRGGK